MTFVSFTFLIFLALFAPLYIATRGQARLWVIFTFSSLFYGWWDWRFLGLVYFSITVDYTASLFIDATENQTRRNWLLFASVTTNLGLLAFFKYFRFATTSWFDIARAIGIPIAEETRQPVMDFANTILLPVGISFYTFQSMSYTFDVYRRVMPAEKSFLRYASFVTFFPQLVAGPIVRADLFVPQLHVDYPMRWDNFFRGLQLIIWGYFVKVVVADSLAPVVDFQFSHLPDATSLGMLLAVVFYAFQIYGDFSGYSLIAIGIGEVFGYDLGTNFNRPYFSQSFSEFWQRWHMSLSTWLRDYLYISLGGNRHGTWMTYRNLMLTMLIGGLWHGANWTFVIWGALHGIYLIVQRLLGSSWESLTTQLRLPGIVKQAVSIAVVFSLTCLAWIFFRAQTLADALLVIEKIAIYDGKGLSDLPNLFKAVKGGAMIALLLSLEALSFRVAIRTWLEQRPALMLFAGAILIWMIALLGTFSGSAFIYFQF